MSLGANRRADTTNRRIFVAVAVLLVVLGALAWAAGWGAITDSGGGAVLSASARSSIDRHIWIGWIAGVVVAVGALVLCLRWLAFELRPLPPHPDIEIDLDEGLHLRVDAHAWVDIVVADIESLDGCTRAQARLRPNDDDVLGVDLLLGVDRRTDPRALGRQLDTWVRKRAEHSLERPVHLDIEIELTA